MSTLLVIATSSYAKDVKLPHSYLKFSLLAILTPQSAKLESLLESLESGLGNSEPIVESELVVKEAMFTRCFFSFQLKLSRLEYILDV